MARKISTPRRSELAPSTGRKQKEKEDGKKVEEKIEEEVGKEEKEEVQDDDDEEVSRSRQGIEESQTNEDDDASTSETNSHAMKENPSSEASVSSSGVSLENNKDMIVDNADEENHEDASVAADDDGKPKSTDITLADVAAEAFRLYKDDIEEQTLYILKRYLETTELLDVLNEEEVANRMVKNNKIAMERAKYQGNLLWEKKEDGSENDDDEEQEQFFHEAYEQEEMFGCANEFFKKVITELNEQLKQQQHPQPPAETKKKSTSTTSLPLIKLDKKTVNWLKRAMGLERTDDMWYLSAPVRPTPNLVTKGSGEDAKDAVVVEGDTKAHAVSTVQVVARYNPQRVTRGVARSTRIQRRQEKAMRENIGKQGMLQAIDEMEVEFGPFMYTRKYSRRGGAGMDKATSSNHDDSSHTSKLNKENQEPEGLIAHMPMVLEKSTDDEESVRSLRRRNNKTLEQYRVVRLVRILVGRKPVRPITRTEEAKISRIEEIQKKRKAMQAMDNASVDGSMRNRRPVRVRLPLLKKARLDHLYDADSDMDEEDMDDDDEQEGRLFGAVNESEILDFSSLQRSSKDPMPLRLLDWQRRHSCWIGEIKQFKEQQQALIDPKVASKVQLPPIFTKTDVQYVPKWEDVKKLRESQKPPNMYNDPPRRRYSDAEYAQRCAKLINALNGPARAWVRHEFFCSDIDRAWYNYNEFAAEVAKLGVRPHMRFTRSEWSMIRRRIPNKPKLFSKRFIFSQLQKRNEYRDIVRRAQIEWNVPKNFDFEVVAPIPVGATVTAFHKRFRILHRGVVLFHDVTGKGYLVLFENKHLGYEFCPDTEVASHGAPKFIFHSPKTALDGSSLGFSVDHSAQSGNLPYGTLLRPPHGMQAGKDVSVSTKLMAIVARPRSQMTATVKKRSAAIDADRKIEEREILGRLLNTIKHANTRKAMILDAIEKFQELQENEAASKMDPITRKPERSRKHYDWLLANLEATNNTLAAALAQMRLMYSKAYAAGQSRNQELEKNVFNLSKEALIQRVSRMDDSIRDLAEPWMFSVVMDCKESGNRTATNIAARDFGASPGRQERHSYLQHRLASAVALLYTAAFCVDRFANERDGTAPIVDVGPVNDVFSCALEPLKLTVLPSDNSDSRVLEADASRWFEARELEEATKILYAELAACRVQQIVRQTNN